MNYSFFVMPGIEVQNMMFASDDVVWTSWQFIQGRNLFAVIPDSSLYSAFRRVAVIPDSSLYSAFRRVSGL
jgi:hypothetical protein